MAKNKVRHKQKGQRDPSTPALLDTSKDVQADALIPDAAIWRGDSEAFLAGLPQSALFDLVVTSPPYNIGKEYESKSALDEYMQWQERIIDLIIPKLKEDGSLCWQVGNFVDKGQIVPLDIEFAPIFKRHGLQLRNRIVWHFGHGLHTRRRFSGRYEDIAILVDRVSGHEKQGGTFNRSPTIIQSYLSC